MTQTSTPAVTPVSQETDAVPMLSIDLFDRFHPHAPTHSVWVTHEDATALMIQLAEQLGYTVLSPEQRGLVTETVNLTVQRAAERQVSYTELRAAGVIA